jgi:hypothetical protein
VAEARGALALQGPKHGEGVHLSHGGQHVAQVHQALLLLVQRKLGKVAR